MFKQTFEVAFLVGTFFFVILFPIVRHIDYKRDCKRWGEKTTKEVWKRF